MKKILIICLSIILFLTSTPIVGHAQDNVPTPRLNNVMNTIQQFSIDSTGEATVLADYSGYYGDLVSATIKIKIQKRFLGVFWSTVDIGEPENTWVYYSTSVEDTFIKTFQLEDKGTYRAVFNYTFVGVNANDEIEDTMTDTYE